MSFWNRKKEPEALPDQYDAAPLWALYRKGVEHHNLLNLYEQTERAYRFYEGDQWYGLESGGEELPFYNFIRPVVNYRSSMVSMNNMTVVYNPFGGDRRTEALCAELNRRAAVWWETNKMDKHCWETVKGACIAGDEYLFFFDEKGSVQRIANTDLYLSDEQSADLQSQRYIILRDRRSVEEVRRLARENGVPEALLEQIRPDEEPEGTPGGKADREADRSRCTCLLKMEKKDGIVHITRSTRSVIFQPETAICTQTAAGTVGMRLYPLAGLVWNRKNGSSRGTGECRPMIPNQIEANKLLFRRCMAAKMMSFGKPVYRSGTIENPQALLEAGTAIEVDAVSDVQSAISYLSPVDMSDDAHLLQEEIVSRTKELAGAGDAALGQIDPTQASGQAILAVRDQNAIPLNEQTAAFRQFCEDIALIWLDLWQAYSPGGFTVETDKELLLFAPDELETAQLRLRIDVTPTDPYSRYAAEQSLENALKSGQISFEEYVLALPDHAIAPRARFSEILERRAEAAERAAIQDTVQTEPVRTEGGQGQPGREGGDTDALS